MTCGIARRTFLKKGARIGGGLSAIGCLSVVAAWLIWVAPVWGSDAGSSATLEQRALKIGNVERAYHLYVPKNLPPDKAAPLVLAFHGRGRDGNGPAFARKTQFNPLAQKEGFMVAYPDGIEAKWLDGGLMNDVRFAKDVEFANAIMDDVAKHHPVDAGRVYATGFSNGAAFRYLVAIRLSHRVAAIASVGANMSRGFLKEMTPDKEPVSLLQFCGSHDPFCGRERLQFDYLISLKENLNAWIKHNGCASEGKTQTLLKTDSGGKLPPAKVWANGRKGTEVVLLWLDGAAHGWPIPTGKDGTLDPTPLIWEFFEAHPKAPTGAKYPGDHHAPSSPPTRYLDEVFPKVSVTRNLAFREETGSTNELANLLLDLYEPAGDTAPTRPAIVWIHGGGFYKGVKMDPNMVALADRFARRGYVPVSINYRLVSRDTVDPGFATFSKAAFSAAVTNATKDARAAVRWLRANAAKFRIDQQRIAIGGGSAGAFTSLHVAYTKRGEESSNPSCSSEVRAVVDFWGGLLDANEMKAGGPPLLIIHGTLDRMVPFAFAEKLVGRAKEVGVTFEFHPLEGEGHAAWLPMDRHIRCIAPFLYRHMIEKP